MASAALSLNDELDTLPKPKVYSYARWSTPEQAKGDSFRRQAEAAARWARKNDLELDTSLAIVDEGVSAYRGNNATDGGLSRFLEACRRGLIERGSYLLVESLDRISRMSPRRVQSLINEIVDGGITIVTLNDGQEYTAERLDNDPMALMIALMVAWRAHDESKTKGRRVADAWEEKRNQVRANPEKRLTCKGPSWLIPSEDGGWTVDEAKAAIVQQVYKMTLQGRGEHSIASSLNEKGVKPLARGKRWHRSTISKLLRNPAVIGSLVPGRIEYVRGQRKRVLEEPVEGAYPSIISKDDWFAVRALKDGRSRAPRGRQSVRRVAHLLAGLARCPNCGEAMTRVYKGAVAKAGLPKLVCSAAKNKGGCQYVSVRLRDVEFAIRLGWGSLFAEIPAGDQYRALEEERVGLLGSIDRREDRLQEAATQLEASPSSLLSRLVSKIEGELLALRRELEAIEERLCIADHGLIEARVGQLHGFLAPTPCEGKMGPPSPNIEAVNALLKTIFGGVVIDYRCGFLRFQWRQGGEASIQYAWPC
ncbi:recombinase family protein [Stakelama pacifica]|uniref:Recombinase-like zinc beta ribbon protein n=1 Tax=Stakelama pacifica TaxID=517720 RepID=A0A4R6FSE6_9SPHN|nr:recombinase family protein [Stakelama pacifica]TDN84681.1 recombinase-like zinc beta ribbon protein [Stakelama pacifica]GGO93085.1 hypothetical protein GCM10011329_11660 [Stakelama pacifica]